MKELCGRYITFNTQCLHSRGWDAKRHVNIKCTASWLHVLSTFVHAQKSSDVFQRWLSCKLPFRLRSTVGVLSKKRVHTGNQKKKAKDGLEEEPSQWTIRKSVAWWREKKPFMTVKQVENAVQDVGGHDSLSTITSGLHDQNLRGFSARCNRDWKTRKQQQRIGIFQIGACFWLL